ncbi:DEAD/DEAH box helicase [Cupriavidus pauculus]|uniref:DEAD/DEAH box helicase n=1 Tax=Cupriavidus pauculus TaxID=82633 RepID=UPI001FD12884|nr:DEAD/DEAH box helicase [Cupriavidus pauculus]
MKLIPRPHQQEAIQDAISGFKSYDRGQLVMACGTGKTLTALWIAEALNTKLTVVFLPSISLLEQFASSWRSNAVDSRDILCVCSDESIVCDDEPDEGSVEGLIRGGFSVTTDSESVAQFLCQTGPRVVFSTYHSAWVIAQAQASTATPSFDLMVCDEAHRCAGPTDSPFAIVLDDRCIRSAKRLFQTATPRVRPVKKGASTASGTADMSNEIVFGPRFHTLSFRRAIELGLLCDYQVAVVISDSDELRSVLNEGGKPNRASDTDKILAATIIGVVKALDEFRLRKVISFHHSLNKAARFQQELGAVADTMRGLKKTKAKVRASFVSGKMKADVRRALLSQLAETIDDEHRVVTNARCLTEGIDVPSVDGIVFVDPRTSEIDIAQALGRALRMSPGKAVGTVVLPILVGKGESPEDVARGTQFRTIWGVLAALRAHDEEFASALNLAKSISMSGTSVTDFDPLGKIRFVGGSHARDIADYLRPIIVEELSEPWESAFELARQRFEQLGNLDAATDECWPPGCVAGFRLGRWLAMQRDSQRRGLLSKERARRLESIGMDWSPTDTKWHSICDAMICWMRENDNNAVPVGAFHPNAHVKDLGQWASVQRTLRRAGRLSHDKVEKLSNAGFAWDPLNDAFEKGFKEAARWAAAHGHCNAPQRYVTTDGFPLGAWISSLRLSHTKGTLPFDRQMRMEGLGILWNYRDAQWEEGFSALAEWAATHGHCNPPVGTMAAVKEDARINLGYWVRTQRKMYSAGLLDSAKIRRLESIGIHWKPRVARSSVAARVRPDNPLRQVGQPRTKRRARTGVEVTPQNPDAITWACPKALYISAFYVTQATDSHGFRVGKRNRRHLSRKLMSGWE